MTNSESTTPTEPVRVETELLAQLLGSDPWARFDVWSGRAWEAAETAMRIAADGSMADDGMDGRVLASFHAAQICKEFSEMVNPLFAVAHAPHSTALPSDVEARDIIMSIMMDDDD